MIDHLPNVIASIAIALTGGSVLFVLRRVGRTLDDRLSHRLPPTVRLPIVCLAWLVFALLAYVTVATSVGAAGPSPAAVTRIVGRLSAVIVVAIVAWLLGAVAIELVTRTPSRRQQP